MARGNDQIAVWRITDDDPMYVEKDANSATWWKRRRAWFVLAGLVLVTLGVVTAIAVSAATTESNQGSGNNAPAFTPTPTSTTPTSPSAAADGIATLPTATPLTTTPTPEETTADLMTPNNNSTHTTRNVSTPRPSSTDDEEAYSGKPTPMPSTPRPSHRPTPCPSTPKPSSDAPTPSSHAPKPHPSPSSASPKPYPSPSPDTAKPQPQPSPSPHTPKPSPSTDAPKPSPSPDTPKPQPQPQPAPSPSPNPNPSPSSQMPKASVRLVNSCGKSVEIMYTLRVGSALTTYYHTMSDKATFDVAGSTFHGGTFRVGRSEEATLFECSRDGGKFWYDLSVVTPNCGNGQSWDECQKSGKKGYNVPMKVEPQNLANNHLYNCGMVQCNDPKCPDAYLYPFDDAKKMRDCHSDEGLLVTICY
ncbi:hypothetical protein SPRG_07866 [Saprolegnia parasitica CBS 223.65]|uniref:Uncharacterized protein n=1 Tax=Saprolegnia parasitica (strain CBS 223.65) TaxID=695850 RepID=A0A067C8S3_SAPPC|nr:hypothetical protein SPRG_07866 [Saprolegnia parasitica CBS 223.65]KDO27159.1 hypothetical protein SPRG_07866 [Saprolegnia parasitica CBS 223.65]|eukprot:XP_012202247.1 hypothetical protein SPRG_07866 [Saprolegnia parasitica CBS 223.65]